MLEEPATTVVDSTAKPAPAPAATTPAPEAAKTDSTKKIMKKIFLAGIGFLMFSCSKKENTAEVAHLLKHQPFQTGKINLSGDQIMETLDCSGCHS
jgi:hypothetical protein